MFRHFTAAQKRGGLILLAILVSILGWRWRVVQLEKEKPFPDLGAVEEFASGADGGTPGADGASVDRVGRSFSEDGTWRSDRERPMVHIELNAADTTELKKVRGIGSVFARRIVKYRRLVGGFRSVEDLQQVYGIDAERFAGIAPQVFVDTGTVAFAALQEDFLERGGRFERGDAWEDGQTGDSREGIRDGDPRRDVRKGDPRESVRDGDPSGDVRDGDSRANGASRNLGSDEHAIGGNSRTKGYTNGQGFNAEKSSKDRALVNINTADSAALVRVKGIGAKTASNLIKYRRLIFYFHSIDQLREVWGMREKNLEMIRSQVTIGGSKQGLPHLEVNTMGVKELAAHYYLPYKEAKIMVAYRDQHGAYADYEALRKVLGIQAETLVKIKPYLRF